jgi:integrase
MGRALTAASVERVKPGLSRQEIPDALLPGLYLIVQPSGAKSWAVRYRHGGKPRKVTLGTVNALSLAEARDAARKAMRTVAGGDDPAAIKKAASKAAAEPARDTVEAIVAEWLKRDQSKNRSAAEVARIMNRDVLPTWQGRDFTKITRRDCLELIDRVHDRAPVVALRIYAYLHRLFRWSVGRGLLDASPMAELPKPGREVSRDRVLTDTELVGVWLGCDKIGWPFGPAIKLLILTGCRREEVGSLRWNEIDGIAIQLVGERTKTKEARAVPLSPQAVEILENLPCVNQPDFVFTTTGRTPVSGWSRAKRLLDQHSGVEDWRVHDLRRTFATGLQRLGTRLEVIEAALGHVSGSRAGIVGVYQRHGFEPEMRRAADAWGQYVAFLIDGRDETNMAELRTTL